MYCTGNIVLNLVHSLSVYIGVVFLKSKFLSAPKFIDSKHKEIVWTGLTLLHVHSSCVLQLCAVLSVSVHL